MTDIFSGPTVPATFERADGVSFPQRVPPGRTVVMTEDYPLTPADEPEDQELRDRRVEVTYSLSGRGPWHFREMSRVVYELRETADGVVTSLETPWDAAAGHEEMMRRLRGRVDAHHFRCPGCGADGPLHAALMTKVGQVCTRCFPGQVEKDLAAAPALMAELVRRAKTSADAPGLVVDVAPLEGKRKRAEPGA